MCVCVLPTQCTCIAAYDMISCSTIKYTYNWPRNQYWIKKNSKQCALRFKKGMSHTNGIVEYTNSKITVVIFLLIADILYINNINWILELKIVAVHSKLDHIMCTCVCVSVQCTLCIHFYWCMWHSPTMQVTYAALRARSFETCYRLERQSAYLPTI